MKKILLVASFLLSSFLQAQDYKYELGHGYKIDDALNIGAYFSLDYAKGDSVDRARLDDVAVLAYGNFLSNFSYLVEFEASPLYKKDYKNDTSKTNAQFYYERMYLNYTYSESLNFRVGKLITPIGYWNLEPINVLRDTSSNPLYSYKMFPKFVTGLDTSGYVNEEGSLNYHFFMQVTDDLDKNYINIRNDLFVGGVLEYEVSYAVNGGVSLGYYETYENKDVLLVQANAKYDNYPYLVQTEWAYTNITNNNLNTKEYQVGGYLQGMYNLNPKHALVARYEYMKDTQVNQDSKNHIGVFGYSYRPVYAISIKGEYQVNSDAYLNQIFISLSVLF